MKRRRDLVLVRAFEELRSWIRVAIACSDCDRWEYGILGQYFVNDGTLCAGRVRAGYRWIGDRCADTPPGVKECITDLTVKLKVVYRYRGDEDLIPARCRRARPAAIERS